MSRRRFESATAKTYTFRDDDGDRNLICLYMGGKRAGFIEFEAARRLVDRIHDLCDEHERQQREEVTNG